MLLRELYRTLDALVNEDGTDDYWGIDDFNRILVEEEIAIMIDVMDEEKKRPFTNRPMTDALLQARTYTADDLTNAYDFEFPVGYLRMDSVVFIDADSVRHKVDFISAEEYIRRLGDMLAPPLEENYICYVEEGDLNNQGRWLMFRPILGAAAGTWGIFFRGRRTEYNVGESAWEIVDPFLDYYIDTNGDMQFMDEDDDMGDIATGTYRDGTDMGDNEDDCETKELYIPIEFHNRLLERFIDRLSLKDRDQLAMGYSINKEQEDAAKNIVQ